MVRNDFVCSSDPYISRTHVNSHTRVYSLRILYLFVKIHAYSCNSTSMVEFAEITECLNGWSVYVYLYACVYMYIYAQCIYRTHATEYVRKYSRVYTCFPFRYCTRNPSCPLFPVRIQFPCPTNNPIYTPDYSGNYRWNRGRLSTLSLPLLPGCCPCWTLSNPSSYVPALAESPWPVRGSDSLELVLLEHG